MESLKKFKVKINYHFNEDENINSPIDSCIRDKESFYKCIYKYINTELGRVYTRTPNLMIDRCNDILGFIYSMQVEGHVDEGACYLKLLHDNMLVDVDNGIIAINIRARIKDTTIYCDEVITAIYRDDAHLPNNNITISHTPKSKVVNPFRNVKKLEGFEPVPKNKVVQSDLKSGDTFILVKEPNRYFNENFYEFTDGIWGGYTFGITKDFKLCIIMGKTEEYPTKNEIFARKNNFTIAKRDCPDATRVYMLDGAVKVESPRQLTIDIEYDPSDVDNEADNINNIPNITCDDIEGVIKNSEKRLVPRIDIEITSDEKLNTSNILCEIVNRIIEVNRIEKSDATIPSDVKTGLELLNKYELRNVCLKPVITDEMKYNVSPFYSCDPLKYISEDNNIATIMHGVTEDEINERLKYLGYQTFNYLHQILHEASNDNLECRLFISRPDTNCQGYVIIEPATHYQYEYFHGTMVLKQEDK